MQCAGINRHEAGNERVLRERSSEPLGAVLGTTTSLPFGDAYVVNGTEPYSRHFAGLIHDYDAGTDNAQFREYSNGQGRWMSPDPYSGSYELGNPQSLNRYSYVNNNPLRFTDPSGLQYGDPVQPSSGDDCWFCSAVIDAFHSTGLASLLPEEV